MQLTNRRTHKALPMGQIDHPKMVQPSKPCERELGSQVCFECTVTDGQINGNGNKLVKGWENHLKRGK